MTAGPKDRIKGRGVTGNPALRFSERHSEPVDDGWTAEEVDPASHPRTEVSDDPARTVISRNQSPDIPFDRSINPYKGCEHGCPYCYARPSHAYLDLSPGLDFETRIFAKRNAAERLRAELSRPGYRPAPIALGANTDPYQPLERRLGITREILEVLYAFDHPVMIVTKAALVERDLDLLAAMAERDLVSVTLSVTTLDRELARRLEPRAAAPARRLRTVSAVAEAGVPAGVLFAPVIPALNDTELEAVLAACAEAGAQSAGYVLLRLPHEVRDLFVQWLETHVPLKAAHVMSVLRQMRGGVDYRAGFGARMRGEGEFATLLERRFRLACRRFGLDSRSPTLECQRFQVPPAPGDQFDLF